MVTINTRRSFRRRPQKTGANLILHSVFAYFSRMTRLDTFFKLEKRHLWNCIVLNFGGNWQWQFKGFCKLTRFLTVCKDFWCGLWIDHGRSHESVACNRIKFFRLREATLGGKFVHNKFSNIVYYAVKVIFFWKHSLPMKRYEPPSAHTEKHQK